MHPTEKDKIKANKLMKQGYRRTSHFHKMLSRIDREDWMQHCIEERYPVDPDWYRRCVSKDTITVSYEVCKLVKSSCHDHIGYVEKVC